MSTRGRKAELKAIEGGLAGVPSPPGEIPADMVAEWQMIAADLVQRELLTSSMSGVLSTYVLALQTVRECRKEIERHGLLVSSAHEKLKPNPACGLMKNSMETIARLSAELGLTPAARAKQGFGNAAKPNDGGAPRGLEV